MKKIIICFVALVLSKQSFAQWVTSGNNTIYTNSENVGIGTSSPNAKLNVNGVISAGDFTFISSLRSPLNSYTNLLLGGAIRDNGNGSYTVYGDGGSNYFSAIRMDSQGGNIGAINFYNGASVGGGGYTLSNAALSDYQRMTIVGDRVGIGTANPDAKLAVKGSIHTQEVKVDMNGWADYVFRPNYILPPLTSVKVYIEQNQHLPDMPSEAEVSKEGINLGEMNKLLVKKVEELTLYLIEKDSQLKRQEHVNMVQQHRLDIMDKKLNRLIRKSK